MSFACRLRAVYSCSAHHLCVPRTVRMSSTCRLHCLRVVCEQSARPPCTIRELSARHPRTIRELSAHLPRTVREVSARIVPSIVHLLTLPFILDSPKWLAKVGQWKECESALQRLRGKHADVYQEAAEIRVYNKFLVWFGIVWSGDMKCHKKRAFSMTPETMTPENLS
ncbi:MFS transporter [Vigna unguiculata]|uniref:MFS transporter n=1 Tax=Vigna unguiculata TaxID=3917 RepID=A0A4D6MQ29_VIGUN|nr:MFS transporter [Vigna unguiculata]